MRKLLMLNTKRLTMRMGLFIQGLGSKGLEKDGERSIARLVTSTLGCTRTINDMVMGNINSKMGMRLEGIGEMMSGMVMQRSIGLEKVISVGSLRMMLKFEVFLRLMMGRFTKEILKMISFQDLDFAFLKRVINVKESSPTQL